MLCGYVVSTTLDRGVGGQSAGPAPAVCMTTATSKHGGGHGGTWASLNAKKSVTGCSVFE